MPYDALWMELAHLGRRVARLEVQRSEDRLRMREIEKRQKENHKDWPSWTEIMSPSQWAMVILLAITTAAGITSPKQILEHFLGPSESNGPRLHGE